MQEKVKNLNSVTCLNIHIIVINVMRNLQKHNLYGFTKRRMARDIIMLMIDDHGDGFVKETFTEEVIDGLIERCFRDSLHKTKYMCVIM